MIKDIDVEKNFQQEDGPAVELSNGNKFWYLNDIKYTEDQYSLRESHRVTINTN